MADVCRYHTLRLSAFICVPLALTFLLPPTAFSWLPPYPASLRRPCVPETPPLVLRSPLGEVQATQMEVGLKELVFGTHSRSVQQWDIWEATFSPLSESGYPARIWYVQNDSNNRGCSWV